MPRSDTVILPDNYQRLLMALAVVVGVLTPGKIMAQTNASDFTYATRYDAMRRVTGTIAPDPDGAGPLRYPAERLTYDAAGRPVRTEKGELSNWQSEAVAPANWSGFTVAMQIDRTFDAWSRKQTEITSGSGIAQTVTQYSYTNAGLLECTAVRMNPATFGALPGSACSLGAEGEYGPDRIARNIYDPAGQLLTVQKAYGTSLQQDYVQYSYTANGKRASVTDANGNRAELHYNGLDRQDRWTFPSKTSVGSVDANDFESYGYDANGNRTSLRRRDGRVLTFGYDALNRMTLKIVPGGCAPIQVGMCTPSWALRSVFYGYDLRGLQTYARYDSDTGEGVITSYDGFGAIIASTTALGGQSRTLGFQYDTDGNRTKVTHPDGTAFDQQYDGLDRPTLTWQPGGVAIANAAWNAQGLPGSLGKIGAATYYGYDGIGRLITQNQGLASNGNNTTFAYNPASQIASESRDNDAYAFTGRYIVDRSYGINGQNQYTSAGPASFSYDANGNLLSDGSTSYVYDGENRLVSTSTGVSLLYDPLGRLWQVSSNAGTTQFLYDGDQLTAEYDGNGNLLRRYVHGGAEDDPLVWYDGAGLGDRRSLMADHQGSVIAVVDGSGNPIRINAYDEYGIPGTNNLGRFQYTGQAFIPELGMYHYKARLYSPTLGRFLQTDPVGYHDQINLYAYVANDPVNRTDPSGECAIVCGAVIGAVVDGGIEAGTQIWNNGKVSDWGAVGRHALTGAAIGAATGGIGNLIRAGGTVIKVGDALLSAGSAGSTRLAQAEVMKAAQATLSGLAKGEGRVFAGSGSKATLREAGNLAKKYGGEAGDYQKVSSKVIAEGSNGAKVEVHAYRNVETGRIFEPKIKVQGGQ